MNNSSHNLLTLKKDEIDNVIRLSIPFQSLLLKSIKLCEVCNIIFSQIKSIYFPC